VRHSIIVPAIGVALALVAVQATPGWAGGTTTRASISSRERQANGNSAAVTISTGGRFVAFESGASNLVGGDTNGVSDIFLRDRTYGRTFRVSVGPINPATGKAIQANGPSHSARGVTPDGRFVVFESFATNLAGNDFNGTWDVFERDRSARKTYLISVTPGGQSGNGPSADPVVSDNGCVVAFESSATNLVGNDSNGAVTDVFVRNRCTDTMTLASVSSGEATGNASSSDPSISGDGNHVAFESLASTLVSGDTNGISDIFVRNLGSGTTTRVSVNSGEAQAASSVAGSYSASISWDGNHVGFESFAGNLVPNDSNNTWDVFVRDLSSGTTSRVSLNSGEVQGNGESADPALSSDGRYVAFESAATNFTPNDNNARVDVFVRDRVTGVIIGASLAVSGASTGNAAASDPSITADGQYVAFEGEASNLVPNDTNGHTDAFVRGPLF